MEGNLVQKSSQVNLQSENAVALVCEPDLSMNVCNSDRVDISTLKLTPQTFNVILSTDVHLQL